MAASSAAAAAAPRVGPSLYGAWRLAKLLVADSRQQMELVVLHLPQQQVAALRALAAGEAYKGLGAGVGDREHREQLGMCMAVAANGCRGRHCWCHRCGGAPEFRAAS